MPKYQLIYMKRKHEFLKVILNIHIPPVKGYDKYQKIIKISNIDIYQSIFKLK